MAAGDASTEQMATVVPTWEWHDPPPFSSTRECKHHQTQRTQLDDRVGDRDGAGVEISGPIVGAQVAGHRAVAEDKVGCLGTDAASFSTGVADDGSVVEGDVADRDHQAAAHTLARVADNGTPPNPHCHAEQRRKGRRSRECQSKLLKPPLHPVTTPHVGWHKAENGLPSDSKTEMPPPA